MEPLSEEELKHIIGGEPVSLAAVMAVMIMPSQQSLSIVCLCHHQERRKFQVDLLSSGSRAIKDLSYLERPREKALSIGIKQLSNKELLAILLS